MSLWLVQNDKKKSEGFPTSGNDGKNNIRRRDNA